MEKIVIEGGTALHGTLRASGAKNAALPILIATLLAPGEHRLTNVPALTDTSYTLSLLGRLGCPSLIGPDSIRLDTTRVAFNEAPYDVVRKMRASVLEVLKAEGYIRGYASVEHPTGRSELEIELKYFDGEPVIREISRVSKPGRRVYASVKNLPRVNNGLGISVLSTPKGIMADHDARDANVGGEVLFTVF